jgi:hypothetical protein
MAGEVLDVPGVPAADDGGMVNLSAPPGLSAGLDRDFDYIAFDWHSRRVIAFGSKAVYALENADERAPNSTIEIFYAGALGRLIWDECVMLDDAAALLSGKFGPESG